MHKQLQGYLNRLPDTKAGHTALWRSTRGQVVARYFHCDLTSAFAPIVDLDSGAVLGHQAYVRGDDASGQGVSPWNVFALAASDEQLVSLDRLCRMLHVLNYFSQPGQAGPLFLHVHPRLLSAVQSEHGATFRHVLGLLGVPTEQVVLDLPETVLEDPARGANILASYRLNGFLLSVNVNRVDVIPAARGAVAVDYLKLDAKTLLAHPGALRHEPGGPRVIAKSVERADDIAPLRRAQVQYGQGHFFGEPGGWGQAALRPGASLAADLSTLTDFSREPS